MKIWVVYGIALLVETWWSYQNQTWWKYGGFTIRNAWNFASKSRKRVCLKTEYPRIVIYGEHDGHLNSRWRNRETHQWLSSEDRDGQSPFCSRMSRRMCADCHGGIPVISSHWWGMAAIFSAAEGNDGWIWLMVYVWNHLNNSWQFFRIHTSKDN